MQSVEDLEQLMRWNDPAVSATAPASAICMRGDIGPSPSTGGCLDSKVSSDALAEELKANAVSGPTEFPTYHLSLYAPRPCNVLLPPS